MLVPIESIYSAGFFLIFKIPSLTLHSVYTVYVNFILLEVITVKIQIIQRVLLIHFSIRVSWIYDKSMVSDTINLKSYST